MDSVMMAIEPLRGFTKDSVRLVNRCTKPDRKGMYVCNHRLVISVQMIVPASTLHTIQGFGHKNTKVYRLLYTLVISHKNA